MYNNVNFLCSVMVEAVQLPDAIPFAMLACNYSSSNTFVRCDMKLVIISVHALKITSSRLGEDAGFTALARG